MSPSPAASSAGTWEMSPAPSLVLPRGTAWWLGGRRKGGWAESPASITVLGGGEGRAALQDTRDTWSHDNRGCGHGVLGEGDGV